MKNKNLPNITISTMNRVKAYIKASKNPVSVHNIASNNGMHYSRAKKACVVLTDLEQVKPIENSTGVVLYS